MEEKCICCGEQKDLEYTCDVCGSSICSDCASFDIDSIICENCLDDYNDGELSSNADYSAFRLRLRQALPLEEKIRLTNRRIEEWYEYYGSKVYVSFSGGKDSTVLLHLVRQLHPEVPAVFSNTGLEYPEIVDFVKKTENVVLLRPKKSFLEVIKEYGFPIISKEQSQYIYQYRTTKSEKTKNTRINGNKSGRGKISKKWHKLITAPFKVSDKCCYHLKKAPFKKYEKESGRVPYIGEMAEESSLRTQKYQKYGCNAFSCDRPISRPMMFWTEKDIWEYLKLYNIPYSSIYDMGYTRTGCIFCGYGCHLNNPNKFQMLKQTHPKLYDYCMNKLGMAEVLDFIGVDYS